jgi:hypothetical protein
MPLVLLSEKDFLQNGIKNVYLTGQGSYRLPAYNHKKDEKPVSITWSIAADVSAFYSVYQLQ